MPRTQVAEERRHAIVAAAQELYEEREIERTSVTDIADQGCGASPFLQTWGQTACPVRDNR
ncbi:MAG: hypothetical protein LKE27_05470 [Atopobiaceae bacterium]|nr:hypothetical protein [Atopobiaceae bacterium]MCI2050928.1 hypothetical protein [Atopobiaceae bacterium]